MFIGGSAGSAAGGVKVARWLIIVQPHGREVRRALHPRAVLPIRVGDRVVGEEVLRAVAAFITLYTGLIVFSTLLVALTGRGPPHGLHRGRRDRRQRRPGPRRGRDPWPRMPRCTRWAAPC
jgi:Trk-type K+ transport system membrane component